MKKLFIAATLVLGMTSVSMAQGFYGSPGYGGGYYGYAPGYGYSGEYRRGYQNDYYYGHSARGDERGGPGPRVGAGSGMGIGSQR